MSYLIDSNIIIDMANGIENNFNFESDGYITKLIYIECLRTIDIEKLNVFKDTKDLLDSFKKLDIQQDTYDKTIDFSRYCKKLGVNIKGRCEVVDFLNFMTAKKYGFQILSNDKDIIKLESAYQKYLKR